LNERPVNGPRGSERTLWKREVFYSQNEGESSRRLIEIRESWVRDNPAINRFIEESAFDELKLSDYYHNDSAEGETSSSHIQEINEEEERSETENPIIDGSLLDNQHEHSSNCQKSLTLFDFVMIGSLFAVIFFRLSVFIFSSLTTKRDNKN
jgi:hypothetical protein